MDYSKRLVSEMKKRGFGENQIKICESYSENLIKKGFPVIFDPNHLVKILKLDNVDINSYKIFTIKGKSKNRTIETPSRKLKIRQRWILDNILEKVDLSNNAHGFVKGRSILSNAEKHISRKYVFETDIKDFFPSVSQNSVIKIFRDIGYTTAVSRFLANLCCFCGHLPQGAPTSPAISNIICRDMDTKLLEFAISHNACYTRYADDLTFSYNEPINGIFPEIEKIINSFGFSPNPHKTRLFSEKERKLITGLSVSDRVRVPKSFKRHLRQEIYYCRKFGVCAHLENTNAKKRVNYKEHLYGKAYYIKMIEPEAGEKFLNLLDTVKWD